MKVTREKESGLLRNIKETKIMSNSKLSELTVDSKEVEVADNFLFFRSRIKR